MIAKSALGIWTGKLLLEYCPYERPGCELKRCWLAVMCRAARSKQRLGFWERLIAESRRETFVWEALAVACAVIIIIAFVWPHLGF